MTSRNNFLIIYFVLLVITVGFGFSVYAAEDTSAPSASDACNSTDLNAAGRAVLKCDTREKALEYLASIPCTPKNSSITPAEVKEGRPDSAHLELLNPDFAICAAEFAKFMNDKYGGQGVCLRQSGRTQEEQHISCVRTTAAGETVCQAPSGGCAKGQYGHCPHVNGAAIDFNPIKSNYQELWSQAPQFGLTFYLRDGDQPHVESLKYRVARGHKNPKVRAFIEQDKQRAQQSGNTAGCLTPGFIPKDGGSINTQAPPSAAITSVLRGFFSPPSQQPSSVVSPGFSNPSSISPQQVIAVTTGTEPARVSTSGSDTGSRQASVGGISSQLGATGTTTRASSTADRLEELAFGVRATSTRTATSVPLIITGAQAVGITGNQSSTTQPTTIAQLSPSISQQTFISADLSWQTGSFVASQPVTGWQATLASISSVLQRILTILQPFGFRNLSTSYEGVE